MGDEILPKIALKSSQNHLHLKQGRCKDTMAWLDHLGIDENDTLQDIINYLKIILHV